MRREEPVWADEVQSVIIWVGVHDAVSAEVRLYDRLFVEAHREAGDKDLLKNLNTSSLRVMRTMVELSLVAAKADDKFQVERYGYSVADRVDHVQGTKPMINLAVRLKDSWESKSSQLQLDMQNKQGGVYENSMSRSHS